MKKEIARLILDKKIIFIIFFAFILFFGASFYYTSTSKDSDIQFSHEIMKYKNDSDIEYAIASAKTELASLDTSSKDYSSNVQRIKENIMIYEYVRDNKISYDDCQELIALDEKNNTRIDYLTFSTSINIFIIFSFLIVMAYSIFVSDQQNRYSIFIYGTDKKRMPVLIKKIVVFFLASLGITIIMVLLSLLMSMALESSHSTLIYVYQNKVISMSVNGYIFRNLISLLFYILSFVLEIIIIALFVKKQLFYIISLICLLGLQFLTGLINNSIMQSLFIYPMSIYTFNINSSLFLIVSGIKFVILIVLFGFGIKYFNKKDLV